jgi:hypothetical protein
VRQTLPVPLHSRNGIKLLIAAAILLAPLLIGGVIWAGIELYKETNPAKLAAMRRIEARGGKATPLYRDSSIIHCAVDFSATTISDEDLVLLDGLRTDVSLNLSGTNISDRCIRLLSKQRVTITWLDLSATHLTDDGLADIEFLPDLWELNLAKTSITNAGLESLAGLKHLQRLNIAATQIDDDGLRYIGYRFSSLLPFRGKLNLSGTNITDAGLVHLRGVSLDSLDLSDTSITDAGVKQLTALDGLINLNLSNTKISDEALRLLPSLNKLDVIRLRHTQVTDAGLAHFHGMSALRYLDVTGTQATKEGVARFKKALPRIQGVDGP